MEEAKLAILTDAKQEYSLQLVNILKSSICSGLKFLYDESKKKCIAEKRFNEVLSEFQEFLSQIRLWSQDMIEQEYRRIQEESGCDFIKELITAVFMSHTQILQSIRGDNIKKQTQIDIPKPEHFIHKCYINSGREFYKNPFFFYDGPEISAIERQKNIPQCENIIATSINETIRQLLPVRNILKTYLQDTFNQEQYDEEEKKESMKGLSQNYQNNLREIVKKEIANYTSNKNNSESIVKNLIQEELIEVPKKTLEQSTHETETEIFELMPELSLDDIDIMVRKQEEEEEREILEQERQERLERLEREENERLTREKQEQERLNKEREENERLTREKQEQERLERLEREENERLTREKQEQERLNKEREENERLTREKQEQERINKEREERQKETKNVIMDNEINKKNKQESKNLEIMVEKKEQPVTSITPIEINERSLYGADLNFDEEINLLDDDISFDPPKKSTSTSMTSSETKYTFFN
jgi:hypothetical protein